MSMIDRLEPRRLMAADAYVNAKGTLYVNGTDGADTVVIAKVDGGYKVTIKTDGGATKTFDGFSAKRVQQIRLDVGAGDDRVTVQPEVEERATLLGGAGDDRIDLYADAGVLIEGGSGGDRIRHDIEFDPDASNTAFTYVTEGSRVPIARSVGTTWKSFFGTGRATLNGGGGNDVIVAGAPGDEIDGGTGTRDRVLLRPGIRYTPAEALSQIAIPAGTKIVTVGADGKLQFRADAVGKTLAGTVVDSVQWIGTSSGSTQGAVTSEGGQAYFSIKIDGNVTLRRIESIEGIGASDNV